MYLIFRQYGWLCCLVLAACATSPPLVYPTAPLKSAAYIRPAPRSAIHPPRPAYNLWQQLPDWQSVDLRPSWGALLKSCGALKHQRAWLGVCVRAERQTALDNAQIRAFFEAEFTLKPLLNPNGSSQGLVTGYYEPKLKGSYTRSARFRYPVYAAPDELVDTPKYYSRAEIKAGVARLAGQELFWVEDEVELFFLQIQGCGRIELPNGQLVRIGHAGHNNHPYHSVGQKLVGMGELTLEHSSMEDIKNWGAQHPEQLGRLLDSNPRYVFFREMPETTTTPIGALGVPLTEGYSIAVDPRSIPLGAPVFLATTYPDSSSALNRLVFAQDTGIAIKGSVRADFFGALVIMPKRRHRA